MGVAGEIAVAGATFRSCGADPQMIFDKVFDRMDRAVVHGSTFAKNDLAMAAGIADSTSSKQEKLSKCRQRGERLPPRSAAWCRNTSS